MADDILSETKYTQTGSALFVLRQFSSANTASQLTGSHYYTPSSMVDDTEITSPFAIAAVPPPPPITTQISTSPFVLQAAAATVTVSSALTQLNVPAGNSNASTSPFVAQAAAASTLQSRQTQDDVSSSTTPFVLAACMCEIFEFAYRVG